MAPVRFLGYRLKFISNDEYYKYAFPFVVVSLIKFVCITILRWYDCTVTPKSFLLWTVGACIFLDPIMAWWSTQGYINDIEGKRVGLNFVMGIRHGILSFLWLLVFWFEVFFDRLALGSIGCKTVTPNEVSDAFLQKNTDNKYIYNTKLGVSVTFEIDPLTGQPKLKPHNVDLFLLMDSTMIFVVQLVLTFIAMIETILIIFVSLVLCEPAQDTIETQFRFKAQFIQALMKNDEVMSSKTDRRRLRNLMSSWWKMLRVGMRVFLRVSSENADRVLKNTMGFYGVCNLTLGDLVKAITLTTGAEFGGRLPTAHLTKGRLLERERDSDDLDFILTYVGYAWLAYGYRAKIKNPKKPFKACFRICCPCCVRRERSSRGESDAPLDEQEASDRPSAEKTMKDDSFLKAMSEYMKLLRVRQERMVAGVKKKEKQNVAHLKNIMQSVVSLGLGFAMYGVKRNDLIASCGLRQARWRAAVITMLKMKRHFERLQFFVENSTAIEVDLGPGAVPGVDFDFEENSVVVASVLRGSSVSEQGLLAGYTLSHIQVNQWEWISPAMFLAYVNEIKLDTIPEGEQNEESNNDCKMAKDQKVERSSSSVPQGSVMMSATSGRPAEPVLDASQSQNTPVTPRFSAAETGIPAPAETINKESDIHQDCEDSPDTQGKTKAKVVSIATGEAPDNITGLGCQKFEDAVIYKAPGFYFRFTTASEQEKKFSRVDYSALSTMLTDPESGKYIDFLKNREAKEQCTEAKLSEAKVSAPRPTLCMMLEGQCRDELLESKSQLNTDSASYRAQITSLRPSRVSGSTAADALQMIRLSRKRKPSLLGIKEDTPQTLYRNASGGPGETTIRIRMRFVRRTSYNFHEEMGMAAKERGFHSSQNEKIVQGLRFRAKIEALCPPWEQRFSATSERLLESLQGSLQDTSHLTLHRWETLRTGSTDSARLKSFATSSQLEKSHVEDRESGTANSYASNMLLQPDSTGDIGISIELITVNATTLGGEQGVYFAVLDHFSCSLVIGFRGTMNIADVISDASYHPVRLTPKSGPDECVNGAFLVCATHALKSIEKTIDNLPEGYRIVCTGHSLGAGNAAVAGFVISRKWPKLRHENRVRCLLIAPPGCICTPKLARESEEYMVTVVLSNDGIPRTRYLMFSCFRNFYLRVLEGAKLSKYEIEHLDDPNTRHRCRLRLWDLYYVWNTSEFNPLSPYNVLCTRKLGNALTALHRLENHEDDLTPNVDEVVRSMGVLRHICSSQDLIDYFREMAEIGDDLRVSATYIELQTEDGMHLIYREGQWMKVLSEPGYKGVWVQSEEKNCFYVSLQDLVLYFDWHYDLDSTESDTEAEPQRARHQQHALRTSLVEQINSHAFKQRTQLLGPSVSADHGLGGKERSSVSDSKLRGATSWKQGASWAYIDEDLAGIRGDGTAGGPGEISVPQRYGSVPLDKLMESSASASSGSIGFWKSIHA